MNINNNSDTINESKKEISIKSSSLSNSYDSISNANILNIYFPFLIIESEFFNYYFTIKNELGSPKDLASYFYYKTRANSVIKIISFIIFYFIFFKNSNNILNNDSEFDLKGNNLKNNLFIYFLMLFVIIIKYFKLKEIKTVIILITLFILDVLFYFLLNNNIIVKEYYILFKLLFTFIMVDYLKTYLKYFIMILLNSKKIIGIYFLNILFFGSFGFILFNDCNLISSEFYFKTYFYSLYTIFKIQSGEKILYFLEYSFTNNIISKIYSIFFVFINFFIINLLVFQMISYIYEKTAIKIFLKYSYYKKILFLYKNLENKSNIINLSLITKYKKELLVNPNIELYEYKSLYITKKEFKVLNKNDNKKKIFANYKKILQHALYNSIFILLDIIIILTPILSLISKENNDIHYYKITLYLVFISTVKPIINLLYYIDEGLTKGINTIFFNIVINILIFIFCIIIPNAKIQDNKTLEQSNILLFTIFGILCFIKLLFIINVSIKDNKIINNIKENYNNILKFITQIAILLFINGSIFIVIGKILYQNIQNKNFDKFINLYNITDQNYLDYINFNNTQNSILYLILIFSGSNWSIYSKYLLYLNDSIASYAFIIYTNFIMGFIFPRLIIGFIIYYIILQYNLKKNKIN